MKELTKLRLMFYFTVTYLAFFTLLAIYKRNYEFMYYTVVMVGLILLVVFFHKRMHLDTTVLMGLTILGALHVLGGNIVFLGARLYDWWLIPNFFRYDHLVHSFGVFVATFVAYNVLSPYLDKKIHYNPFLLALILVLIAMGAGALNEVIELGAVLFVGAAEGVGDYMNNALDMFFNLIGASIASIFILGYHKKIFGR